MEHLVSKQQLRIGIDLGGTKIECVALDATTGKALWRQRTSTPRHDYQGTVAAIANLVHQAEADLSKSYHENGTVGVGIPGTVSAASGLVKNANSTWLIGQNLQADLQHALLRDVRLSNDANCFAVSEAVDGAGAEHDVVFGVILGTGVGAGFSVHRQVWPGINGVAGEWGHNPLPRLTDDEFAHQQDCFCGRRGCIETWLAGPSFARLYQLAGGEALLPPAIIELASKQQPLAVKAFDEYCQRLAKSLAHVVNVLDPSIIVLGGGMSNIDVLYPKINAMLADWVFGGECDTKVVKNIHGDSSGVRGAAWLWGNNA
ncbi:ROK family protein [Neiella marina]|uniref:ROK family protein n=1 Tax=Neiella holothuriorum TaxID=2870530 RepID=A0ABS7EEF6_9GAMM|nr:ROK family protein [Neiella holothuriorum]MBW8190729.1 ROK family protein [Neiella holothuriorum]